MKIFGIEYSGRIWGGVEVDSTSESILQVARGFDELMHTIGLHIYFPDVQIKGAEGQNVPFAAHDGRCAARLRRGWLPSALSRPAGQRAGKAAHDAEAHQWLPDSPRHTCLRMSMRC